jgi:transposase, IS6 family
MATSVRILAAPQVTTDQAPAYPRALDELLPTACHVMEKYANNPIEADHGRLKSRLRPMRGLRRLRRARVISAGHAFVRNVRRGHDVSPTPASHNATAPR